MTPPPDRPLRAGVVGLLLGRAGRHGRRDRARAVRRALWSLVVVGAGAYAASLAVPLWFDARHERLLVVTSGSMAPAFDTGDAVVLRTRVEPSELRAGTIVSFRPPGSDGLVTHRIREVTHMPVLVQQATTGRMVAVPDPTTGEPILREHLVTQGDANRTPDRDAVPVSRVRGVVVDVHAGWGAALAWAHSDLGRLTMLAPPLAALAGMEIASILGTRRTRRAPTVEQVRSDELVLG